MSDKDKLAARWRGIESALAEVRAEYERGAIDIGRYTKLIAEHEMRKAELAREMNESPNVRKTAAAVKPTKPAFASRDLPRCLFIAGPKITDARLFVGRKNELRLLVSKMSGAQPISVNVHGERRIGKSSLLYQFYQTWLYYDIDSARYAVIYYSLQDTGAETEVGFYRTIIAKLRERLAARDHADLAARLEQEVANRAEFGDALRFMRAAGVLPVICLDEFEELLNYQTEFDDAFYDFLRARMESNELMLIISSKQVLDVYQGEHHFTSSFFNIGHTRELRELTEDAANDLVRLPASRVAGAVAALDETDQRRARDWAGKHPYLLQLAASSLCEARQQGYDLSWAEARFEEQLHRFPFLVKYTNRELETEPAGEPCHPRRRMLLTQLGKFWRVLWRDFPIWLGKRAKFIGGALDDLSNWLIGAVIIIVVILAILGYLNRAQVLDLFRAAFGGGG